MLFQKENLEKIRRHVDSAIESGDAQRILNALRLLWKFVHIHGSLLHYAIIFARRDERGADQAIGRAEDQLRGEGQKNSYILDQIIDAGRTVEAVKRAIVGAIRVDELVGYKPGSNHILTNVSQLTGLLYGVGREKNVATVAQRYRDVVEPELIEVEKISSGLDTEARKIMEKLLEEARAMEMRKGVETRRTKLFAEGKGLLGRLMWRIGAKKFSAKLESREIKLRSDIEELDKALMALE
jgi:hypothetical protein